MSHIPPKIARGRQKLPRQTGPVPTRFHDKRGLSPQGSKKHKKEGRKEESHESMTSGACPHKVRLSQKSIDYWAVNPASNGMALPEQQHGARLHLLALVCADVDGRAEYARIARKVGLADKREEPRLLAACVV